MSLGEDQWLVGAGHRHAWAELGFAIWLYKAPQKIQWPTCYKGLHHNRLGVVCKRQHLTTT
jgi:hypothetical protein